MEFIEGTTTSSAYIATECECKDAKAQETGNGTNGRLREEAECANHGCSMRFRYPHIPNAAMETVLGMGWQSGQNSRF